MADEHILIGGGPGRDRGGGIDIRREGTPQEVAVAASWVAFAVVAWCLVALAGGFSILLVGPLGLGIPWPSFFGYQLHDVEWWWKAAGWAASVIYSWVWWNYGWYRVQNEITDPAWPGPLASRDPNLGPAGPWWEGHGPPAAPEPEAVRHIITIEQTTGASMAWADLPDTMGEEKLVQLLRYIVGGSPVSERALSGKGRILSGRAEWEAVRDAFLSLDWFGWENEDHPQQGVYLTFAGMKGATQALKRLGF